MRLTCVFFLCCLAVHSALADDTNTLPGTITVDGITYSNITWRTVTPATVSIFHQTGVASIPLEKLSPDLQRRFGYDPAKAATFIQKRAEADAAAAKLAAERLAEEQKREAGQAAQRAHEEELNNLRHQLAGSAQQFMGQVTDVFPDGLLIFGGVPNWSDQPALLIGHPRQKLAAEGDHFICMASRYGVYEYKLALGGTRTVARWIYISELGDGRADFIGRTGPSP